MMYAEQQTNVLEDTVKTHYEAKSTAANVLMQLHTQHHQLQSAHDDVWDMRITAEEGMQEFSMPLLQPWPRRTYYFFLGLHIVMGVSFVKS